jgi:hypothetical protein
MTIQHDTDDLKRAFRQGGLGRNMDERLDAVAEVGAKVGFEDAKVMIVERIDDLIWRRTLADKDHDELDTIRDMVQQLEADEE